MENQAKTIYLRFLCGEENAFAELVRLLGRRFYRMFYHLTSDRMASEDLCQEFFTSLFRSGHTFRSERDFLPWAYAVARNLVYRRKSSEVKVIALHQDIADVFVNTADELGISGILEKLSEEKRTVFELKHFQELKFSEIAEIMGIPEGTVKSRMSAAVKEIREILLMQERRMA